MEYRLLLNSYQGTSNMRKDLLKFILCLAVVAGILSAAYAAMDTREAMRQCQELHSFETCFTTLNN
jgi:hypothetical protein